HTGASKVEDAPEGTFSRYALADRAPRYDVVNTEGGVMYTAYRPAETDSVYYRIAQFLFPFYAMVPTGVLGLEVRVRAWGPMDDEHTLALTMAKAGQRGGGATSWQAGSGPRPNPRGITETLPNTSDWLGRFRCVADATNDYQIDREAQRNWVTYSGLPSIFI